MQTKRLRKWTSVLQVGPQSTYVRWKRGHAHTAEEGSSLGDDAARERPESSSSDEDDDDVISEAAPEEQPSGAVRCASSRSVRRCDVSLSGDRCLFRLER